MDVLLCVAFGTVFWLMVHKPFECVFLFAFCSAGKWRKWHPDKQPTAEHVAWIPET